MSAPCCYAQATNPCTLMRVGAPGSRRALCRAAFHALYVLPAFAGQRRRGGHQRSAAQNSLRPAVERAGVCARMRVSSRCVCAPAPALVTSCAETARSARAQLAPRGGAQPNEGHHASPLPPRQDLHMCSAGPLEVRSCTTSGGCARGGRERWGRLHDIHQRQVRTCPSLIGSAQVPTPCNHQRHTPQSVHAPPTAACWMPSRHSCRARPL